jgi:hypothetical protein
MSDHERRAAQTQALFRLINEKMFGLNVAFATATDSMEVVCECSDVNCIEQIELPRSAYTDVRSDPIRFIVVSGHAEPTVDEVVAHHDGYEVVRLTGPEAVRVAREAQPSLS